MTTMLSRLAALASLALIAGCYSTKPYSYTGHDSDAAVIVYRKSEPNLSALATYVGVDDRLVAQLGQQNYVEIPLAPGKHVLSAHGRGYPNAMKVGFEIEEHGRLYYEAKPNTANTVAATASVVETIGVGAAFASIFIDPFLLRPSDEEEYKKLLDVLERIETASGPAGK